jgi:hypothetical protein
MARTSKGRAFVQGNAHRMTRRLATGADEQALHGTLRHADPNCAIAFEDLGDASPADDLRWQNAAKVVAD